MSRDPGERQILRQSAFLYSSVHVFIVFKFLAGFVVARFLGPTLYGLRSVFGLVVEYEHYSHLGTYDAMRREVPFYRGRGDDAAVDRVRSTVFSANMTYALVVCAALSLTAALLAVTGIERIYVDFVVFLAVHVVLTKLGDYLQANLVADKKTDALSRVKTVYGIVNAVATVGLVYGFGLRGLFIGLLLGSSIRTAMLRRASGKLPAVRFDRAALVSLLRIGFPIMLIALMLLLLRSVDRVIIVSLLSRENLGYFAVATIVSGVIYHSISEVIAIVFFPRVMETLGRSGDLGRIKRFLIEPTVLVAYFTPILIGVIYLAIHLPFRYFVPRYVTAIPVSQTLTLGAFFLSVVAMALLVSVALNRQVKVVLLTFVAVVVNAVLSYALIRTGQGIGGVAVGTAVSYFVFATILIAFALHLFGARAAEYLRTFALIYAPFVHACIVLAVVQRILVPPATDLWRDLVVTTIQCSLFVIGFLPALFLVRRHPAFVRLRESLPRLSRPRFPRQADGSTP